jgi:hypothetical protein
MSVSVAGRDIDANFGVFGVEFLDQRQRDLVEERRRDVDADRAAVRRIAGDAVDRRLDPVERLADLGQQRFARRGQHQPRSRPVE